MKNQIIKPISVALILIMSALIITGCDLVYDGNHIFPEGYTGGFGSGSGPETEFWWVESYGECIDAIKLLKSHGSTFDPNVDIVLNYDEDLFDVKYCFIICGDGRNGERIKFGDNPFDRWAYDVMIFTYIFFDDVTIDELVYSNVKHFEAYRVEAFASYKQAFDNNSISKDGLEIKDLTDAVGKGAYYYFHVNLDGNTIMAITSCFFISAEENESPKEQITDECINKLIFSKGAIELND